MAAHEEEQLGWQEIKSGQLNEAEHHFRRALELDPNRADALNGLGTVYLAWGEVEEAQELFQLAVMQARYHLPRRRRGGWKDLTVQPFLRGLFQLAVSLIRQELWEEALRPLEEILSWDSEGIGGEVFYRIGEACHHLGDLEAAVQHYRQVSHTHPFASYCLGLAYFQQLRDRECDLAWSQAILKFPELAPLLMHYPTVVPIPVYEARDLPFRRLIHFIDEMVLLWDSPAQERLMEHYTAFVERSAERQ